MLSGIFLRVYRSIAMVNYSNINALQGKISQGKGFSLGHNTSENGAWHLLELISV